MGSASTLGLIGPVRRADVFAVSALDEVSQMVDAVASGRPAAPAWMRTLAAVLAMEGWAWPAAGRGRRAHSLADQAPAVTGRVKGIPGQSARTDRSAYMIWPRGIPSPWLVARAAVEWRTVRTRPSA